jgi:hypothetical protein
MFLRASIERILNDTGSRKKENIELRKSCEEALGKVYKLVKLQAETMLMPPNLICQKG